MQARRDKALEEALKRIDEKPLYMSLAEGFYHEKPNCFRCGDCCQMTPVEISEDEVRIILGRIKKKERKMFLESITTDFDEANTLPEQLGRLLFGVGWMRAPCMFLEWEKHRGRMRTHCRIFKIRPRMCRIFYCGKGSPDEPLIMTRYIYKIEKDDALARKILSMVKRRS